MKRKLLVLCLIIASLAIRAQTTITSSGNTQGWNQTTTWVGGVIPETDDDVIVAHLVFINTPGQAINNLTVNGKGDLRIREDRSLTVNGNIINNKKIRFTTGESGEDMGSIILDGTYSGSGSVRASYRPTDEEWHLVSSPLVNASIPKFLEKSKTIKTNGEFYALGVYNDANASGSKYEYYTDASASGEDFIPGKGYATKGTPPAASNLNFLFIGDINDSEEVLIPISDAGFGFNLVGNPYVASLFANTQGDATNNVLTANEFVLEEMTLWFFNGSTGKFQTTNLGTTATGSELLDIAPVQGFFVKAKAGGNITENFKITKAMQTHNDDITSLKSNNNRFEIDLSVNSNEKSSKTSVWYLENTTTDFDNGYDSSTFGGAALSVFTELVTNSAGKKLAIQSLPNEKYEDMVIPVGIIAAIGSEITFSTEAINIPATYNVYLEDRTNETFTRLDEAESEYTTTVSEAITKGRFYVHTKTNSTLNTGTEILNSVSIYITDNSNLQIIGLGKGRVSVKLYNILGEQVSNSSFEASNNNAIKLPRLAKGVYIVNLQTEKGSLNKKIVLE